MKNAVDSVLSYGNKSYAIRKPICEVAWQNQAKRGIG